MFKKVALSLLVIATTVLLAPTTASAASYVPIPGPSGYGQEDTLGPGSPLYIYFGGQTTISGSGYIPGEIVDITITTSGPGSDATLVAALRGIQGTTREADDQGGVGLNLIVPVDSTPETVIDVRGVGEQSGRFATFKIHVELTDTALPNLGNTTTAGGTIAATGATIQALVVWSGAGLLLMGAAMLFVRRAGRRTVAQK